MDTEERVLRDFSTLAVVGASRHPEMGAVGVLSVEDPDEERIRMALEQKKTVEVDGDHVSLETHLKLPEIERRLRKVDEERTGAKYVVEDRHDQYRGYLCVVSYSASAKH